MTAEPRYPNGPTQGVWWREGYRAAMADIARILADDADGLSESVVANVERWVSDNS